MKKIFTIILLAVVSAAAFSQEPNKQLQQLEKYLRQQGYEVDYRQFNTSGRGSVTQVWNALPRVTFHQLPDDFSDKNINRLDKQVDSIDAVKRKKMEEILDSVRLTFALLGKDASESYCFEYHKNGTDTIKYSLAFSKDNDTLYSWKNQGKVYFENAKEAASFEHCRNPKNNYALFGYYRHAYSVPSGYMWDDMQSFDTIAFEALINPVLKATLKLKGSKTYPVYWRHDEGYEDSIDGGLVSKTTRKSMYSDNKHTGLTKGIYYFIPLNYNEEAEALRRQLDSLAYDYVNSHPEQPYYYSFYSRYNPDNLLNIVHGASYKDDNEYYLSCMFDDDGYHILSLKNKGELWIPREWPILKSWINGEKVYLKGMAPKKNKDKK